MCIILHYAVRFYYGNLFENLAGTMPEAQTKRAYWFLVLIIRRTVFLFNSSVDICVNSNEDNVLTVILDTVTTIYGKYIILLLIYMYIIDVSPHVNMLKNIIQPIKNVNDNLKQGLKIKPKAK